MILHSRGLPGFRSSSHSVRGPWRLGGGACANPTAQVLGMMPLRTKRVHIHDRSYIRLS